MNKNEDNKFKEYSYNDIKPNDFRNEKDFTTSIEHILTVTSDLIVDWKKREDALKRLGSIILGNYGQNPQFIKIYNTKLYLNLNIQMADLRSSLMKEACRIVILSARELGHLIEPGIEKMLTSAVLYRLAGSANKLISETCANTIYQLIRYVQTAKIIGRICEQASSKGNIIRLCCANELVFVVLNFNQSLIMKNQQIIEDALRALLSDPNGDVRFAARKAYFGYNDKYKSYAKVLYNQLERNIQKAINDDEINGNDDMNQMITNVKNSNVSSQANSGKKMKQPANLLSNSQGITSAFSYDHQKDLLEENNDQEENYSSNSKQGYSNNNSNSNSTGKGSSIVNNYPNVNQSSSTMPSQSNPSHQKLEFSKTENIKKNILKNLNNRIDELTALTGNSPNIADCDKEELEKFLKIQLDKIDNTNLLGDKISGFDALGKRFNDTFSLFDELNKRITKKLIDIHIENLTESDKTLITHIMKNLYKFFFYLSHIFSEFDVDTIIKLTMTHLCSKDAIVGKTCNQLLEVIRKKIDANQIFKSLLELLTEEDCDEETCFMVMMPLIDNCKAILQDATFFNSFFNRLCDCSKPDCQGLIELLDKLFRQYNKMFMSSFTIVAYENKKKLKYILDCHNSYMLKHLVFESIAMEGSTNSNSISSIGKNNNRPIGSNTTNKPNTATNTVTSGNKTKFNINPNDLLSKEMMAYIKEKNKKSFIDYALVKDMTQIRKFLINLVTFNEDDMNVALIFLFDIISNVNFAAILNDNLRLIFDSLIYIIMSNPKHSEIVKEIIILMPLKLKIEPLLTLISKNMTTGTDTLLIQIFLMSIKNFVVTNKDINLNDLLPYFIDSVFNMLNHQSSDIRKHAVYCAVEIYLVLGNQFEPYMNELQQSQQNLIRLFIKKKTGY